MTTHDEVLLNDMLDDRLSPQETDTLAERLERESALRRTFEEMTRARAALRAVLETDEGAAGAPEGFLAGVQARIEADDGADEGGPPSPSLTLRPERRSLGRHLVPALAAAALVVIGLALAYRLGQDAAGPAPITDYAAHAPESASGETEASRPMELDEAKRLASRAAAGGSEALDRVAPPAAPTTPADAFRARGPVDGVPAGLRTPSDVPTPVTGRGAPPARVYVLEVEDLDEGRARLALLLDERHEWKARSEVAAEREEDAEQALEILTTIEMDLTAAEQARLARAAVPLRGDSSGFVAKEEKGKLREPEGRAKAPARPGTTPVRVILVRRR